MSSTTVLSNQKMSFIAEVDVEKEIRKDFRAIEWNKEWDNESNRFHKHTWIVIDFDDESILCQGIKQWPFWVWHPIVWNNYQSSIKWAKTGCIGEIQESMSNLHVGFKKNFIERLQTDEN